MDNILIILSYLAKKNDSFTLLELSSRTKIPYSSLYRTVNRIEDLVDIQVKGKSKLVKIKWSDVSKAYLVIASYEEKKQLLERHSLMKRIDMQSKDITLIFGSYAKNLQTKNSDIDVMVINKKGDKTANYSNLEMLFDIKINPMFFSEKEFKAMLKDKGENVGKQAMKDHVLLTGFNEFWSLVRDGFR